VKREKACQEVEDALRDPRTAVASITELAGMGKTALCNMGCSASL